MLLFGGVDLATELRASTGWDAMLYARGRVVHAAALAGLDVMDMPYLAVDDPDGLAGEATRARDMGYGGKAAIHPVQVPGINAVFTPHQKRSNCPAHFGCLMRCLYRGSGGGWPAGRKAGYFKMQHILAIAEAVQA